MQLLSILHETGVWVIGGQRGRTIGYAASLKHAIERAHAFAASGAVVIAIYREPNCITIYQGQLHRLQKLMAGPGAPILPEVDKMLDDEVIAA